MSKVQSNSGHKDIEPWESPTGKKFISNGKQIASYFRSAVGLAKIRALIESGEDAKELKSLVKILYRNQFIDWKDFYYDRSRYRALLKRLEISKISHPIALIVTIKEKPEITKTSRYRIKCYSNFNRKNTQTIVIPQILTNTLEIANLFVVNSTYILTGMVWIGTQTDKKYRNVFINIQNKVQFQIDL